MPGARTKSAEQKRSLIILDGRTIVCPSDKFLLITEIIKHCSVKFAQENAAGKGQGAVASVVSLLDQMDVPYELVLEEHALGVDVLKSTEEEYLHPVYWSGIDPELVKDNTSAVIVIDSSAPILLNARDFLLAREVIKHYTARWKKECSDSGENCSAARVSDMLRRLSIDHVRVADEDIFCLHTEGASAAVPTAAGSAKTVGEGEAAPTEPAAEAD